MSVQMSWTLQQAGWLWFHLTVGEWEADFNYGWCADFPKDLLAAVTALLGLDVSGEDAVPHFAAGVWEPAEDRWTFARTGETLHITIDHLPDGRKAGTAGERTELTCSPADFGAALLDSLTDLLTVHGLAGYALNWVGDFPISRYLQLLAWRRGRPLARRGLEHQGEHAWATDWREELRLMDAEQTNIR